MAKRLYVGNLPYQLSDEEFRALFDPYGPIEDATLMRDNYTGQMRGFGFVQLSDERAEEAIAALNGRDFKGRPLRVNEARPKEEQDSPRGGGGRREGGGYSDRGGSGGFGDRGGSDRGGSDRGGSDRGGSDRGGSGGYGDRGGSRGNDRGGRRDRGSDRW